MKRDGIGRRRVGGRWSAPLAWLLALAAILTVDGSAAARSDEAFGRWVVENGRAVIEIHPCGQAACGRIAWLAQPFDERGAPKTDLKNPDPGLRNRRLCGLPLISGLQPKDAGGWEGGRIYNSKDGSVWDVEIAAEGADRLEVRGYYGISLLGKTQIWTRETGFERDCTQLDRPGANR